MTVLRLKARAKLNLCLDITGLREDGYHLIDSVMTSTDLYDDLTLEKTDSSGFAVSSSARFLPTDRRNVAVKAANALAALYGRESFDARLFIKKNIPTQAGLGGGSADAAAVLLGLRELFSLDISDEKLRELGASVGADVPFCLAGGCARVGGIGELIKPLPRLSGCRFVIVMPRYGTSTKEAFARCDGGARLLHPDTDAVEKAVRENDVPALAENLGNVFEQLVDAPDTEKIKAVLLTRGALGASLTGSGSAVFGLFPDIGSARRCRNCAELFPYRCYVARPD